MLNKNELCALFLASKGYGWGSISFADVETFLLSLGCKDCDHQRFNYFLKSALEEFESIGKEYLRINNYPLFIKCLEFNRIEDSQEKTDFILSYVNSIQD